MISKTPPQPFQPPSAPGKPSSALPNYKSSADEYLLLFTLHDHVRVKLTAGFDIQRLQTSFESSTLLIINISPRVQRRLLKTIPCFYGVVEDLRMPSMISAVSLVTVRYSDAAEVQELQDAFNSRIFFLTINDRTATDNSKQNTEVRLQPQSLRTLVSE